MILVLIATTFSMKLLLFINGKLCGQDGLAPPWLNSKSQLFWSHLLNSLTKCQNDQTNIIIVCIGRTCIY